jgi:hypothetical protein
MEIQRFLNWIVTNAIAFLLLSNLGLVVLAMASAVISMKAAHSAEKSRLVAEKSLIALKAQFLPTFQIGAVRIMGGQTSADASPMKVLLGIHIVNKGPGRAVNFTARMDSLNWPQEFNCQKIWIEGDRWDRALEVPDSIMEKIFEEIRLGQQPVIIIQYTDLLGESFTKQEPVNFNLL